MQQALAQVMPEPVARLLDGGVLSGSAKLRRRAADATVFLDHLRDLDRLAESGRGWAREAMQKASPKIFVSAGGFTDFFDAAVSDSGHRAFRWTLDDLF